MINESEHVISTHNHDTDIEEASSKALLYCHSGQFVPLIEDTSTCINTFNTSIDSPNIITDTINCTEALIKELIAGLLERIIGSYLLVFFFLFLIAITILALAGTIGPDTLIVLIVGLVLILTLFAVLVYIVLLIFIDNEIEHLKECFTTALDEIESNYDTCLENSIAHYIHC